MDDAAWLATTPMGNRWRPAIKRWRRRSEASMLDAVVTSASWLVGTMVRQVADQLEPYRITRSEVGRMHSVLGGRGGLVTDGDRPVDGRAARWA